MRLSLLDFGGRQIVDGGQPAAADISLQHVIRRAVAAERFGYARYWLAQHFNRNDCWAYPEPAIAAIASRTSSISVGAAGLLINHLGSNRIASDYALLSALAPGRIDLGLSLGAPEVPSLRRAVPGAPRAEFAVRAAEIVRLLRDRSPDTAEGPTVLPHPPAPPAIWALGSSPDVLALASTLQLNICASLFHGTPNLEAFAKARVSGGPGVRALAVSGCCAETNALAQRERERFKGPLNVNFASEPRALISSLRELAVNTDVDEIVFLEMSLDPEARLRSTALLAAAAAT